jgi:membrane protein DedA with SNARE-associated domain
MVAIVAGSSLLFFAGRRWGQTIIKKVGRFIFLKEEHIKRAERLFARYGIWTIIIGRHIPGMRVPITLFAAISGVRYRTFILSTMFSAVFWVLIYLYIGARYGSRIQQTMQHYVGLSIGVIVGVIVLIIALHLWGAYREGHRAKKE